MKRILISVAVMAGMSGVSFAQDGANRDDQLQEQPGRIIIKDEQRDTRDVDDIRAEGQIDLDRAQPAAERQPVTGRQPGMAGADARAEVKLDANKKIKSLASANNLEIKLSQHVEQQGQDPQVKQFAQQMIRDHQQAKQRLQQVARKKNVQLSQDEMMPHHQAKLDHFKELSGAELDTAYTFDQAGHHMKDTLVHQHLATQTQDDDLRQYAMETLPALQQHLQHATELAQGMAGMDGSAMPAGGRLDDQGTMNRSTDPNRLGTDGTGGTGTTGTGHTMPHDTGAAPRDTGTMPRDTGTGGDMNDQ